jgi:hypothetical protein
MRDERRTEAIVDRKKKAELTYELIPKDTPLGEAMYAMLDELVMDHHEDLELARIALAWNRSWKPDVDGRETLGKMKKATDLDRELMEFDFVLILNEGFWMHQDVTDIQRHAVMDHELHHGALKLDPKTLEVVEDAKGRRKYRIRKHDIEEFSAVVRRWGCWKHELEQFYADLQEGKDKQPPLPGVSDEKIARAIEKLRPKPGSGVGSVSLTDDSGHGFKLNADGTSEKLERPNRKKSGKDAQPSASA